MGDFVPPDIDQQATKFGSTLPTFVAAFYRGLLREGLTNEEALTLTQSWLAATVHSAMSMQLRPPEEKEDS